MLLSHTNSQVANSRSLTQSCMQSIKQASAISGALMNNNSKRSNDCFLEQKGMLMTGIIPEIFIENMDGLQTFAGDNPIRKIDINKS